jgi:hypothetical protein
MDFLRVYKLKYSLRNFWRKMMKFFPAIIFSAVFISSFTGSSFTGGSLSAGEYASTAAQKHFTAIVKGLPGVVSAEWKSPISLWVKVSSKAVGSPPKLEVAKQPFCVHIYQGSSGDLSKSCVY